MTVLAILWSVTVAHGAPRWTPSSGVFDTSFGVGGSIAIDLTPTSESFSDVVIDPSGRIIAVGAKNGWSGYSGIIVRFLPDGTLDTSFATGGVFTWSDGASSEEIYRVAIDAQGRIVAGGRTFSHPTADIVLLRLDQNGVPDASFGGGDGEVVTDLSGSTDYLGDLEIAADGRIVAGIQVLEAGNSDIAFARWNVDGSPDTSFDGDGFIRFSTPLPASETIRGIALQANGSIVGAAGYYDGTRHLWETTRVLADGSLDSTWDGDGVRVEYFTVGNNVPRDVVLGTDGAIIVGGDVNANYDEDVAVAKYDPSNGTLDPSFGGGDGLATFTYGSPIADQTVSMRLQPDGRILLAGISRPLGGYLRASLVRFMQDTGVVDTSLDGDGGLLIDQTPYDQRLNAVAVAPDLDIVAVGTTARASTYTDATVHRFERADLAAPVASASVTSTPSTVSFRVSALDEESGLASEPYSFDGGVTWQAGSTIVVGGLSEGQYLTRVVHVRDRAGNVSDVGPVSARTTDTTPPRISGVARGSSYLLRSVRTIEVTDTGYGLRSANATFGGRRLDISNGTLVLDRLPEGRGMLRIEATDLAGNVRRWAQIVIVDRTAPKISVARVQHVMRAAMRVRSTDAVSGIARAQTRIANLHLGRNVRTVRAVDRAGNRREVRVVVYRHISLAHPARNAGIRFTDHRGATVSADQAAIDGAFGFDTTFSPWYLAGPASPWLVREVELRLRMFGFLPAGHTPRGQLDLTVIRAIQRYQGARGLPMLGTVGPRTRVALDSDLIRASD